MTVRFDEALRRAVDWALEQAQSGAELDLVRDMLGHIRVVPRGGPQPTAAALATLHDRLGAFSPGVKSLLVRAASGDDEAERRVPLGAGIGLIDRLVSEQDWSAPPVPRRSSAERLVFFGVKGGVGRSTALSALALQLSTGRHGQSLARSVRKKVLVVDLDLESPGSSAMLLGAPLLPRFGVLDGLVEDAVDQADDQLVAEMSAESPLGEGRLWVAPVLGSETLPGDLLRFDAPSESDRREALLRDGSFVSKLGRAYASAHGQSLATRIERLLEKLEERLQPDVVLLDSRAGLHDISAALVPRLGARRVFLFAGAGAQTWLGYRLLFASFRRRPEVVREFRESLQVVASLVPETDRAAYLRRLRERAYEVFLELLYDRDESHGRSVEEVAGDGGGSVPFTHDVDHDDAPHYPIPIYWRRELLEWDPSEPGGETLSPEQFDAAFGAFLGEVTSQLMKRSP